MNKEFIVKIIKAKQLEYEAIKEILPDNMRKKLDKFEQDSQVLIKDVAIELMKENAEETKPGIVKNTKKVEVDFS